MLIATIILRALLLVLYASDIMLNRKLRKKDVTLRRQLNKKQEIMKFVYHFIVMAGLLTPIKSIFIVVTLASTVFFFFYTDREVYANMSSMNFRGQSFEFKKIKNFTYENNTFEFDYNNEHHKLKNPFLDQAFIEREIVHRIEKIAYKQEQKQKLNK